MDSRPVPPPRTEKTSGNDAAGRRPSRLAAAGLARASRNAREALAVLAEQSLGSLTNFLAGIWVARSCRTDDYGLYVLGFSLLVTLQLLLRSIGAIPFTVISLSLSRQRRKAYLGSTLFQQAVLAACAAAAFLLGAGIMAWSAPGSSIGGTLIALAAAAAAMLLRDFTRAVMLAELRVRQSLLLGLLCNSALLGGMGLAYAAGWLSVSLSFGLIGLCYGVPAVAVVASWRKKLHICRGRLREDIAANWRYGRWVLAATAANVLGPRMVPWLVLAWCSTHAVAVLGVVVAVAGLVNPVIIGAAEYMTPKLADVRRRHGLSGARRAAGRALRMLSVFGLLYALGLWLWGEKLAIVLYTAAYGGQLPALVLAGVCVALEAVNVPLRALARVVDRPDIEFRSSVAATLATLAMGTILVPSYGVAGAAAALMGNRLTMVVMNSLLLSRAARGGTASSALATKEHAPC